MYIYAYTHIYIYTYIHMPERAEYETQGKPPVLDLPRARASVLAPSFRPFCAWRAPFWKEPRGDGTIE